MGKQAKLKIILEIKSAKYYSISVDSTPDCSHVDQLTFIIRYVKEGKPIERFLEFIPIQEHGSEYLANTILAFLEENQIPIEDCRGQTYDNASNMSGAYSGLQARLQELCKLAIFIPCAGHSLNLVGTKAAECVMTATSYFQLLQKLYTFFAGSTNRWEILKQALGQCHVVKSLSDTRWSARADAVYALQNSYNNILSALNTIEKDENKSPETRNEAASISKKNDEV